MMKMPIIERSVPQSASEKALYGGMTVLFWVFWVYLWLPVLALLAWTLGLQQAFKYMVELGGYHELVRLLLLYGLIIVLMGVILIGWAGYNILRFTGVERRVAHPPVSREETARTYGVSVQDVEHWHKARTLLVTHDEKGRVARVEMAALPHKAAA